MALKETVSDVKVEQGFNAAKSTFEALKLEGFDVGDFSYFQKTIKNPEALQSSYQALSRKYDVGDFHYFKETLLNSLPKERTWQDDALGALDKLVDFVKPGEATEIYKQNVKNLKEGIPLLTKEARVPQVADEVKLPVLKRISEDPTSLDALSVRELAIVSDMLGVPLLEQAGPQLTDPTSLKGSIQTLAKSFFGSTFGAPPREGPVAEALDEPISNFSDKLPDEPPEFVKQLAGKMIPKGDRAIRTFWRFEKGIAKALEQSITPANIALGGAVGATARSKELAGAFFPALFTADMVSQNPELIEGVVSALEQGDTDQAVDMAAAMMVSNLMAFGLGAETVRRVKLNQPTVSPQAASYVQRFRQALEQEAVQKKLEQSIKDRVVSKEGVDVTERAQAIEDHFGRLNQVNKSALGAAILRQRLRAEEFEARTGKAALIQRLGSEELQQASDIAKGIPSAQDRTKALQELGRGELKESGRLASEIPATKDRVISKAGEDVTERAQEIERQLGEQEALRKSPQGQVGLKTSLNRGVRSAVRTIPEGQRGLVESPEAALTRQLERELGPLLEELGESPVDFFREAKLAIIEAGKGIGEVLKGDPGALTTGGLLFTEEGFAAALPHFKNAWRHAQRAGVPFSEFVESFVREYGEDIRPFLLRYRRDLDAQSLRTDSSPQQREVPFEKPELVQDTRVPTGTEPEVAVKAIEDANLVLKNYNREWNQKLADLFSVEARDIRLGAPKVGLAKKTFFSIENRWQDQALQVAATAARRTRKAFSIKPRPEQLNELALVVEQPGKLKRIRDERREPYQQVVKDWQEFKNLVASEYAKNGEKLTFTKHVKSAVNSQIFKRENAGENVQLFKKIRPLLDKLEPASLEASLFMEDLVKRDFDKALDVFLELGQKQLALGEGKLSYNLSKILETGLVKPEELNIIDTIADFGYRSGKDLAILNIRKAAVESGMAQRLKRGEGISDTELFTAPPPQAVLFEGYKIHPVLHEWLNKMSTPNNRLWELASNGIAMVKFGAFYNPLFLPMYDIFQAAMIGAARPHMALGAIGFGLGGIPGGVAGLVLAEATTRTFYRGFHHALKGTELYYDALSRGMSSQPYANLLENFNEAKTHLKQTIAPGQGHLIASALSNGVELLKVAGGAEMYRRYKGGEKAWKVLAANPPTQLVKQVYNLSWGLAWQLDRGVRMSTNLWLRGKGFGATEAAQIAAKVHGDYASVPPETRRFLNAFLFTPTFKIAMAKFYAESYKAAGKVGYSAATETIAKLFNKNPGKKLTKREKLLAQTHFYRMALNLGVHGFMLNYGFKTIVPFNKYSLPTYDDEGPKENVVSFSSPANLDVKYLARFYNTFEKGPSPFLTKAYNAIAWDLTPMARVAQSMVQNRDSAGEPIVLSTDSPKQAFYKTLKYGLFNTAQVTKLMAGEAEDAQSREALANDVGKLFELATRPFTFSYLKDPDMVIGQSQIDRLIREYNQNVKAGRIPFEDADRHIEVLMDKIEAIYETKIAPND